MAAAAAAAMGGEQVVLTEEIDPEYEPTEEEINEYGTWLNSASLSRYSHTAACLNFCTLVRARPMCALLHSNVRLTPCFCHSGPRGRP